MTISVIDQDDLRQAGFTVGDTWAQFVTAATIYTITETIAGFTVGCSDVGSSLVRVIGEAVDTVHDAHEMVLEDMGIKTEDKDVQEGEIEHHDVVADDDHDARDDA